MIASVFDLITSPKWLVVWEVLEFVSIIVVGVGCWGEVWAEHHKFAERPYDLMPTGTINKRWERIFWLMVVWGLALELFAFTGSFLASNREISEANNRTAIVESNNLVLRSNVVALEWKLENVRSQVANNDPTNGPIRTVEAHVFFALNKRITVTNHSAGMQLAWLNLFTTGASNSFIPILLMTDHFEQQVNFSGEQRFSMDFHLGPDVLGYGGDFNSFNPTISASNEVAGLDAFSLVIAFLPMDADLNRGFIALKVNNVLTKEIAIPPQKLGRGISFVSPLSIKVPEQ